MLLAPLRVGPPPATVVSCPVGESLRMVLLPVSAISTSPAGVSAIPPVSTLIFAKALVPSWLRGPSVIPANKDRAVAGEGGVGGSRVGGLVYRWNPRRRMQAQGLPARPAASSGLGVGCVVCFA